MSTTLFAPNAAHRPRNSSNIKGSARVVVKYRNQDGRVEVLNHSICVHYDFDEFDNIVCVTIPLARFGNLEKHPNIEHVVLDGRIGHCVSPT